MKLSKWLHEESEQFSSMTMVLIISLHPRSLIKIIYKTPRFNLLHLQFYRENINIIFNWQHKRTYSRRYLNYLYYHHLSTKIGSIINLIDHASLLSHNTFLKNKFSLITQILRNSYPKYLIRYTFKTATKFQSKNQTVKTRSEL